MTETPAKKAAAKAPAKKTAANAPAKKAAAKAPAKKTAANAPATPNFTLETPNFTPETPNFTPDVEAAAERIKQTSDRVLTLSKENGLICLSLRKDVGRGAQVEEDTAQDLGSDWVETLVSTQADFIRNASQAYLSALRDRLK